MGDILAALERNHRKGIRYGYLYGLSSPANADWPFEEDEHGWYWNVTIGDDTLILRIRSRHLVSSFASLPSVLDGRWEDGLYLYKQGSDCPWYNEDVGFTEDYRDGDGGQKHSFCDGLETSTFVEVLAVFMQAYHSGKDLKSELTAFWGKQTFK